MRFFTKLLLLIFVVLLLAGGIAGYVFLYKPSGESFAGEPQRLTQGESASLERMRVDLTYLAQTIGKRLLKDGSLDKAKDYIALRLKEAGYDDVLLDGYDARGKTAYNISVIKRGNTTPDEVIVVGAHYDTAPNNPGADDNGSGTVAVMELARLLKDEEFDRTIHFVLFPNEESPYFQTEDMGSLVYARALKQNNVNVVAMYSLEMLGYYSDEPNSQFYPPPLDILYPSVGNFVGFVGNNSSRSLLHRSVESFREKAQIASEGSVVPEFLVGVGWSDHWSFWEVGYPGIMVTDTAFFRNDHYHTAGDTVDTIDFDSMTRAVYGLKHMLEGQARK